MTDRLLAELHAARSLGQRPLGRPAASVAPADLWSEIRRPPGAPVSLPVARALRDDPAVGRKYRRMLEAAALGFAPVALAASDGDINRRIGAATLRLLPAVEGGLPLLVIEGTEAGTLELIGPEGLPLRIALPPADAGTVMLTIGDGLPEAERALQLLEAPDTALYLLP